MLISLSVENFRSFAAEETFSLVASNRLSSSHEDHTVAIPDSKEKALRTAVIYGANGAGKSNLFKALRYVRDIALQSRPKTSGTGRDAFRFGDGSSHPSAFDLQFIAGTELYRFGFKADDQRIVEEWLVRVVGGRETTLYERLTSNDGKVVIAAPGLKSAGEKVRALATVGGPPNQSFLATLNATLDVRDLGEPLARILAWFRDSLKLIAPGEALAPLAGLLVEDPELVSFAAEFLKSSSTGVDRIDIVKRELSPEDVAAYFALPKLRGDDWAQEFGTEFVVDRTDANRLIGVTIQPSHRDEAGNVVPMDLREESDGTLRLLNLIPALHQTSDSSAVFVIDEIDRSLHPLLAWKFLEFFLTSSAGPRRQIVVTTHESNLLDLDLLRRDEIWFAEKDQTGATRLYSLVDFKVRNDLEIRKHYLQGRFGAVPFLGNLEHLLTEKGQPG